MIYNSGSVKKNGYSESVSCMECLNLQTNKNACCFTGHRKLLVDKMKNIITQLDCKINGLIDQGVNIFYSGGDLGFDQIAASLIISKKEEGVKVKLVFVLPHKEQDKFWTPNQKLQYYNLIKSSDKTIYISDRYISGCMKMRNYYMVEHSSFCICALLYGRSGTFQTVSYAGKLGLEIINVAVI